MENAGKGSHEGERPTPLGSEKGAREPHSEYREFARAYTAKSLTVSHATIAMYRSVDDHVKEFLFRLQASGVPFAASWADAQMSSFPCKKGICLLAEWGNKGHCQWARPTFDDRINHS